MTYTAPLLTRNDPAGEADLDQISFYLGRAYYTYVGLLERVLADMGLDRHIRPGMGNVLFALFERDEQSVSEVAQRLRVAKSTMTGMVAGIKNAGLVTTHRDPADGRAVRLKLTPRGRSLEPRCRQLGRRIDIMLCRRFSKQDRATFKRLLATLVESMTDQLGALERQSQ